MPAPSAEMVTRSVSEMRPSSTASRVRRMVISFVTEATARGASAFSSKRIWPLWGSRSSAAAQFSVIGGAPLLGVEGAVVKAHGSSGAEAISNAVRQARTMLEGRVVEKIRAGLSGLEQEQVSTTNLMK